HQLRLLGWPETTRLAKRNLDLGPAGVRVLHQPGRDKLPNLAFLPGVPVNRVKHDEPTLDALARRACHDACHYSSFLPRRYLAGGRSGGSVARAAATHLLTVDRFRLNCSMRATIGLSGAA